MSQFLSFFFFLHEGDYTIAGLGSGLLAKWSFGFSQVCCLIQLVWLTLLQTAGFLFLCFQVLPQTPRFSRLQASDVGNTSSPWSETMGLHDLVFGLNSLK